MDLNYQNERIVISRRFYNILKKRVDDALIQLKQFQEQDNLKHNSVTTGVSPDIDREMVLRKILKGLETVINNCIIVDVPKNNDKVRVGHYVSLLINKEKKHFFVEGASVVKTGYEVISTHSPVGKMILGKKIGDVLINETIGIEIKIESISLSN